MLYPPPSTGMRVKKIFMYPIQVCSNSWRHIPDPEPPCPMTWGCSPHGDSAEETSPTRASPLPSSTSPAFPKHSPFSQEIRNTKSLKLAYVLGGLLAHMESVQNPMQFKVLCIVEDECSLHGKCASSVWGIFLTVMFPARKKPHFPVSAIWHRDCINSLMDLAKGITSYACGRSVNVNSLPCAYSLNFKWN